METLLALDRKHDPFFAGVPYRRRQAVWFSELYYRWSRANAGRITHLRRLHYWIANLDEPPLMLPALAGPNKGKRLPYENSRTCWDKLGDAARDARLLGLVPRRGLDDKRSPAPHLYAHDRPGPRGQAGGGRWPPCATRCAGPPARTAAERPVTRHGT